MNFVTVYSKSRFKNMLQTFKNRDVAIISIEATDECVRYYNERYLESDFDNEHFLKDADNILNVDFDDITEDLNYDGYHLKAITPEIAKNIYNFINRHLGKDFIIHCNAGQSRSVAVARYILDMFGDKYDLGKDSNTIDTPNIKVLSELKRCAFYDNYSVFNKQ